MKIAVPTRGTNVDDHFGHCEKYTIFSVNEKREIDKSETFPSPQGCGCKSNIGGILEQKGVTVLLAGNMGDGALSVLQGHGIEVVRENQGEVISVVQAFLQGNISDSGKGCSEHGGTGHECAHQ